ncbi:uncharacterized protein TRIADDRAFT_57056 [Trichoplax adhaerens]|uniref:Uncharacterized protein n=1 Tax=Trichoplax adhaerens TaxID=10228 RepID=B3S0I1_TRIAD|nr:predicted protein [Trichoplax adhaerens]EDV24012.1 predicted protein [Trichoplax adhaerens]|eukprot:XP_002113538.1 predicted protein [Trichoplax adhaerens]
MCIYSTRMKDIRIDICKLGVFPHSCILGYMVRRSDLATAYNNIKMKSSNSNIRVLTAGITIVIIRLLKRIVPIYRLTYKAHVPDNYVLRKLHQLPPKRSCPNIYAKNIRGRGCIACTNNGKPKLLRVVTKLYE